MDNIVKLIYVTIVVSASGALSPGPLTITTITLGSRCGWKGGFMVAFGHMLVELPYIIMLFFFFSVAKSLLEGFVGDIITLAGSGIIIYFALLTIRDSLCCLRQGRLIQLNPVHKSIENPIVIGLLFTGLNVWFLIWWLSIGLELILVATQIGFVGLLLLFLSHIWLDYLWLSLVAEAGRKGSKLIGVKGYTYLMLILGIFLALFGINMALKRFTPLAILP